MPVLIPVHQLIDIPEDADEPTPVTAAQLDQADLSRLGKGSELSLRMYAGVTAILRRRGTAIAATLEITVASFDWLGDHTGRNAVFAAALKESVSLQREAGHPVDHTSDLLTDADLGFTIAILSTQGPLVMKSLHDRFAQVFDAARQLIVAATYGPALIPAVE